MKVKRVAIAMLFGAALGIAVLCGWSYGPSWARAGVPQEPLPDLTIDAAVLRQSIRFETERFASGDCAVVEGCVSAPGRRKLLRFSVFTPNAGTADLFLGAPEGNPMFEFSACHGHYHLDGYANYELLNQAGGTVVVGRKQAFCLLDSVQVDPEAGPAKYDCGFQGISAGWADVYTHTLDCQWLDITGVPPGQYRLRVMINPEGILDESSFENNTATARVRIR